MTTDTPIPQIALEPDQWHWLIGQSVALVLAIVWILTLLRDNLSLRMRNDALSDCLLQSTESALQERLRQSAEQTTQLEKAANERAKQSEQHALQLDASQRAVTEAYTRLLEKALTSPGGSSKRSGREPLPSG